METISIYVLIQSKLIHGNEITDRVVGVTADLKEAEAHKEKGIENEYREFSIDTELLVLSAETTLFLKEIREFKTAARDIQTMLQGSAQ